MQDQNVAAIDPSQFLFAKSGASTIETVSKNDFNEVIVCEYEGKHIYINPPIYTGLPTESVYSYKANYRFQNGNIHMNIALEDGSRYFEVDKTGKIVSDNYQFPSPAPDDRPSAVGDAISSGENMYFYSSESKTEDGYHLLGLMDSAGNQITAPVYKLSGQFLNGYAAVMLSDSENQWSIIDQTGQIIGTIPEIDSASVIGDGVVVAKTGEPGAYEQQLYRVTGEVLSDTFDFIGYFYHGLVLAIRDNKVGLIDDQGNTVLEPTIAYDKLEYLPKDKGYSIPFMEEDAFVLPIGGEFAIITIGR